MKHPKDVLDYKCRDCRLWRTRIHVVWGSGNPDAVIGFIGEGPGREENIKGEAFVGRSGKLLRKIIKALKIKEFIILNVVKCRPPDNRNPRKDEIEACKRYLKKQIKCLPNIKVFVLLGRTAWTAVTGLNGPVMTEHGKTVKIRNIHYIYTFHPSFLLRNQSKEILKAFISDIRKAKHYAETR